MSKIDPQTPDRALPGAGEPTSPAAAVHGFIRALLPGYQAARAGVAPLADASADQRVTELLLAEAAVRYACLGSGRTRRRPRQVAVLGPTQTGKSTVVNSILGAPLAEVSPLAGFTIHPQGFPVHTDDSDPPWAAELFPGWHRADPARFSREDEDLECYALSPPVGVGSPSNGLPPCVIWDTPDFDSLAAHSYRRGVLEVAALADAHVLVLSKEKYADLSVWRMLRLLEPLGRPLIVCLNKLTPDAADAISASLERRLAEIGGDLVRAPIITFEYQVGSEASPHSTGLPGAAQLRQRIAQELARTPPERQVTGLQVFVRQHWPDWVAPLEVELEALRAWAGRVDAALDEATESYRRDFLDHPQRFDTFRRATVELLHLLELPGFAGVLGQVRHVLSWPARRLFAARQTWTARWRRRDAIPHGLGSEEIVIFQLIEKLLTSLERDAARRSDPATPGHAVWRALARRLERRQDELRSAFQHAARQQRDDFAPVIQATASQLYASLQKKPAMLNTLRAARATTDVAAIAVALKTGGLGLNDLLFAPAMFALASMMTEGALGSYMTHVANQLKKRQLEHVRAELIRGVFARELHALAADLEGAGLFGISPEQLQQATQALAAWEHSHDE